MEEKQNLAIVPVGEVQDFTVFKYPYRNLTPEEQEFLLMLYDRHNGNVLAISRDQESDFHSPAQLYYYRDLYAFKARIVEIRQKRIDEYNSTVQQILVSAKVKSIEEAIKLLETRQITLLDKNGDKVILTKNPTYQEIKAAWEIIKTELGEPTTIFKREGDGEEKDEITNHREKLNELISNVKTAVTRT
ncbi:MAG: hypothetical protein NTZ18_03735 [Candidatus Komeilibacteria bacterium]|nr:hypothetical protein [Candidatus Komeilibacteria bacterium]